MTVNLACRVGPQGLQPCQPAIIENISRSGALLRWTGSRFELPHSGEFLTIDIDLPENRVFGRKCMECRATVVRVALDEANGPCVALSIDQVRFREYHPIMDASTVGGERVI